MVTSVSQLNSDTSLVSLPSSVNRCAVFRNVVSEYEEQLIWEELSRVLAKEGQNYHAEPTKVDAKVLRNTYVDLHGDRDFTELKNWRKQEKKALPGMVWTPTVVRLAEGLGKELLGVVADTARVVEHHLPGYELHTEHPTVGSAFLYLSLLSDTVLEFDDEASGRVGQVYLPQRSLMVVSGEARWGWRFGEHPTTKKVFRNGSFVKTVRPDLRLSVQLWRFNPALIDRRSLQDDLEEAVRQAEARLLEIEQKGQQATTSADKPIIEHVPPAEGSGMLGGDLVPVKSQPKRQKSLAELEADMQKYKKSFSQVQGVLKEMKTMQDSGKHISEDWIGEKMRTTQHTNVDMDDEYGYDPKDPEKSWDEADKKARFYKAKLKSMDYDGSAAAKESSFNINTDEVAPLDVKDTISKLAPHMKDGDKILSELPFMSPGGR